MRKPKKIHVLYEYIGDRSEADRIECERRMNSVFDMLFTKITKKLIDEQKIKQHGRNLDVPRHH